MAWIELHQTLPTNKKSLRLKRLLKIKTPQAVGHLCLLWLWALDNAPDGDLSGFTADELTEVSEWPGKDPDKFIKALQEAGFIDSDMTLHDWSDYAGKLIDKRKSDAERKRVTRSVKGGRPTDVQRTSNGCPADVQRNRTVPYRTVPNSTISSLQEEKFKAIVEAYSAMSGNLPTPGIMDEITGYADTLTGDVVKAAIDETSANGAKSWNYTRKVLQNWSAEKIDSLDKLEAHRAKRNKKPTEYTEKKQPPPTMEEVESMKAFLKKLKEEQ